MDAAKEREGQLSRGRTKTQKLKDEAAAAAEADTRTFAQARLELFPHSAVYAVSSSAVVSAP